MKAAPMLSHFPWACCCRVCACTGRREPVPGDGQPTAACCTGPAGAAAWCGAHCLPSLQQQPAGGHPRSSALGWLAGLLAQSPLAARRQLHVCVYASLFTAVNSSACLVCSCICSHPCAKQPPPSHSPDSGTCAVCSPLAGRASPDTRSSGSRICSRVCTPATPATSAAAAAGLEQPAPAGCSVQAVP